MTATRGTSRDVHRLDKLRHTDPKTARKMTRDGNGARHRQLGALIALEGGMAMIQEAPKGTQRIHALPRTFLARITDETYDRLQRLNGKKLGNTEFFTALLDALERPVAIASLITNEAANIIKSTQEKLGLPTQLDTVRRMNEALDHAHRRAEKIKLLEDELTGARETNRILTGQRDDARAAMSKGRLIEAAKAARPEAEGALLDFIAAFTGATATADPSGRVVVALDQEKLNTLFPVWAKACEVLEITGKAA